MMLSLSAMYRVVAALGVAGGLAVVWAVATDPDVPATLPPDSLFEVAEQPSGAMALDSADFVFRPLFVPSRLPEVTPNLDTSAIADGAEPVGESAIEGIVLLGTFVSGDTQGVIVSREGGERLRIVEGESVDGWQLLSVEPRAAQFASGSGRARTEDRLEMGVITTLASDGTAAKAVDPTVPAGVSAASGGKGKLGGVRPKPTVEPAPEVTPSEGVADAPTPETSPAAATSQPKSGVPTFDSIYSGRQRDTTSASDTDNE